MVGRPKKPLALPHGLKETQAVKVTNPIDFRGAKLGLIVGTCKEGGIKVWLTADSKEGFSKYTCIHEERGDTIEGIEIDTRGSVSESV
jgi:hypothetical protein